MLRLTKLSNMYRRRPLRALYAHTQAYPYACRLDSRFVRSGSQMALPGVDAGKAAIHPGSVMVKTQGENVTLATGGDTRPFGLCANFVGGEMDELGDNGEIGVWRGHGSVFELLAPAFAPDITADDDPATADGPPPAAAAEELLGAGADGRLSSDATGANNVAARLISVLSARAIIVELRV